ncbi:hypothetical protein [Citricoccus sp. CH26A]|uniref:hypothetical protein n=1 Tax=Citricoccus TaxID=169133 RepID=UPI0011457375|nr:hypothetical protein [Citricoccus sp. CH26A]
MAAEDARTEASTDERLRRLEQYLQHDQMTRAVQEPISLSVLEPKMLAVAERIAQAKEIDRIASRWTTVPGVLGVSITLSGVALLIYAFVGSDERFTTTVWAGTVLIVVGALSTWGSGLLAKLTEAPNKGEGGNPEPWPSCVSKASVPNGLGQR